MVTEKELKSGMVLTVENTAFMKSMEWNTTTEEFVVLWKDKGTNKGEGSLEHSQFEIAHKLFRLLTPGLKG